jgi:serine protease Do
MKAPRAPRVFGSGELAFLAATLIGVIALGVVAGDTSAKSSSGFLGVSTQELDDALRESYDYRGPGGVLVQSVETNSAADRAGVRRGDVLVRYAGTTISTPGDLGRLVRADEPGKRVPVSVWRDGREIALQVTVGARSTSESSAPRERTRVYRTPEGGDDDDHAFEWDEMPHPGDMARYFDVLTVRPRLGVEIQDLNADLGAYFEVPDGRGVLVTRVVEDTPASRAGVKAGDVILEIGGDRVGDTSDLRRELAETEPGPVRVTVMRRGARQALTAQIEAREAPRGMAMRVPRAGRMRMETDRMPEMRRDMDELERELRDLRREMEELRRDSDR